MIGGLESYVSAGRLGSEEDDSVVEVISKYRVRDWVYGRRSTEINANRYMKQVPEASKTLDTGIQIDIKNIADEAFKATR